MERPISVTNSDADVYLNICDTLKEARKMAFSAVNFSMVEACWDIGRQIDEVVENRAKYEKGLLQYLAKQLIKELGKGFDESNLCRMRQFYQTFLIRGAVSHELSWTHYRLLMVIDDI